ncbi:MAG: D-alanyl-D-alanine carboxypeptidase [Clostridiales bacterium]|nr:D-alanyl-D-alanine carboxypeptidase [Clostridiales bacterium]
MKKTINFLLCLIILIIPLCLSVNASYNSSIKLPCSSEVAYLENLEYSTVVFDINADERRAPASLTKIATAAVVLKEVSEKGIDIENTIITVPDYAIRLLDNTDSSTAGVLAGEQMSIHNMLYCLLLSSGNDASNVLADYFGDGNIQSFVDKMNSLALSLGCTNTHFNNAHGLDDPDHYTTARDLAKITKYALHFPVFETITDTYEYTVPETNLSKPRELVNTNKLITTDKSSGYYYEYAHGVKTGTTDNAGHCLISTAKKDGQTYISVVMGGLWQDFTGDELKDNGAFLDTKAMFSWAFENMKVRTVADPNQIITVVDVKLSWTVDHLRLVPSEVQKMLVPSSVDSDTVMIVPAEDSLPEYVNAPIKKGQVVAKARIMYADEEIGTIDLVAAEGVKRSIILSVFSKIKTVFTSIIFKIAAAVSILLIAGYVTINIIYNKRKNKIHMVRANYNNKRR